MTGILEQILADLQAIKAHMGIGGQPPAQQYVAAQPPAQQQYAPAVVPAQPPPANITSEQVTQLIEPHIGNEQIKLALGVAMRAMGINALPETPVHRYGELYQAFQGVIARFTGGGQQQAAPPQAASII